MNDDLISRNSVMDYLREQQANIIMEKHKCETDSPKIYEGMLQAVDNFINFIVQAPTAYDTDKVIHELKEASFPITDLNQGGKTNGIQRTDNAILYERILEIVKAGYK